VNSVAIIRLLLDGGLVVLIWIVQLIIYPSFLYYNHENLITWHKKYTFNFGKIVIPLMLGQLGIAGYQLFAQPTTYTLLSLIAIVVLWLSTFLQFAPIHLNIAKGIVSEKMLVALVNKNWIRTVLWSLLFVYSLLNSLI